MKHLSTYLLILVMALLASCEREQKHPELTVEPDNAALELYYRYADNTNLTVAYLGDLTLGGNKIDALMIQTDSPSEWEQLKLDFAMTPRCDSTIGNLSVCPDDSATMAVGIGFDTDFLDALGLDTITNLDQVDGERFEAMTNVIADKIRDIVGSFKITDSVKANDAVIVGQTAIELDGVSMSTDEYTHALAVAIGNSLLEEIVAFNDSANNMPESLPYERVIDSTMRSSRNYGHSGYISAADDHSNTLWLFFYDNQEECNNILTHIKEDLLITQQ